MFLCFLSSCEDGIDKSPNPFGCNLNRIEERLDFLFKFQILFLQLFKTLFPNLCAFICLLVLLLVFDFLSLFRKTIERKIGNTWYVIETECDGNEPLTDKVKRLIFSDKGVIC